MKQAKRLLCIVLALILTMGLTACGTNTQTETTAEASTAAEASSETEAQTETVEATGTEGETRTIVDMMGNEVEIPAEVESIAIATPVHTVFAMVCGAADKLVTWPMTNTDLVLEIYPEAADIPKPFGADANLESLINIDPDVVILADGSDYIESCQEMEFPVVLIEHTNFDLLMDSILTIGQVAGEEEYAQAQEYVAYFRENQELVADRLSDVGEDDKVRAAYLWGADDELYSYGSDTVQHAFLTAIGATNPFDYLETYKQISVEDVIAADLDAIVCSRKTDYGVITTAEEWSTVPAVANGQVYYCPKGMNGFIAVQPEIALGIIWGASCLYPEQMEGIDLNQYIKDYYQEFMDYELSDEQVENILTQAY